MGEINQGGLPDLDLDFSKSRGGLPDLDPTRFLSRYYPPRDISPISGLQMHKHILVNDILWLMICLISHFLFLVTSVKQLCRTCKTLGAFLSK